MEDAPRRGPGTSARGIALTFLGGARLYLRGIATWARHPGPMLLALLPVAIVLVAVVAGLVAFALQLPALTEWATPFADGWADGWREAFRAAVGLAAVLVLVVLASVSFTTLALAIGEPFYARVWRVVERDLGGTVPDGGLGFWAGLGDAIVLVLKGLGVAIVVFLVGLVPVVGGVAAAVVGFGLTARLVTRELLSRPLEARGLDASARSRMLRGRRALVFGFGAAVQASYLVPLGVLFAMPAAVAGATHLAHRLLEADRPAAAPTPTPTPAPSPGDGQDSKRPISD